ncbi:MAG: plastocyanin/azurin family copper-binding protein [Chloroflexota bacterium]
MMRKLRFFCALVMLPWLLVATVGAQYASAAPAAQTGPQTFTVLVGNGIITKAGDKPSFQGQNFYPGTVTLNEGDSIVWKFNSGNEPHTVTFLGPVKDPGAPVIPDPAATTPVGAPPKLLLNPVHVNPAGGTTYDGTELTNSGIAAADIPGPKEYKLTFTKAGSYDYLCMLHATILPDGTLAGMVGKVVVQAAGSALPMTPDQVAAEGASQITSDSDRAKSLEPAMAAMAKPDEKMADGTTMHHVMVGNMDMQRNLEYQRFVPAELHINVGDTVNYSLGMAPAFHTVTMGDEPDLFTIEPQQQGPPKLVLNPAVAFPTGGNVHTGTGYYNSGVLAGPNDPPEAGIKDYMLTFTKAGRYEYLCVPHYSLGMSATIIVEAAGTGAGGSTNVPGMPTTGSTDQSSWALLTLLSTLLVGAGALVRMRSRKKA